MCLLQHEQTEQLTEPYLLVVFVFSLHFDLNMETYSCLICGDVFSREEYFVHMHDVHNGKLYVCLNYVKCGKAYKTSAALKIHTRNQHPPTTEMGMQTMASFNVGCWVCVECGGTEEFVSDDVLTSTHATHVCAMDSCKKEKGLYDF